MQISTINCDNKLIVEVTSKRDKFPEISEVCTAIGAIYMGARVDVQNHTLANVIIYESSLYDCTTGMGTKNHFTFEWEKLNRANDSKSFEPLSNFNFKVTKIIDPIFASKPNQYLYFKTEEEIYEYFPNGFENKVDGYIEKI